MEHSAESVNTCPFCGARVVIERAFGRTFSVVCPSCGAVAVHPVAQGRPQLELLWNARKHRVNLNIKSAVAPCPFCASRQTVLGRGQSGPIIQCQSCGMRVSFATADTPAAALRRWNKRG